MSTTIDQRVVEMQFDNRHFERNVSNTMSTLDKLKQRLNLSGASKGLENVDAAAKRVNMSGLGDAVEAVRMRFSALQVMGTTALANITNSAINAGKKIVSALTIEPIKTGLAEYETQINAVQTILANTESKGTTLKDVNGALDELNTYADKTIYNFTEMTRNIGTFTAAGVDLDTSVNAIQGIANLAAVSGSNSQQASTAMYQLSQAMASGTVKLMDWNSVVNAGMGGQVFQDALKETARVHGVKIDDMIKKQGSFRETLQEGWLTTDILTETLSHFTMAAEEGSKEWDEYKKSLMDSGYSETQANAILKLSNTATDAATKVKTASQLFDTLKETAQSGWTQTWELLFGDFEEAKTLFSELYETFAPMLEASSKARNDLLKEWADAGGRATLIDSLRNAIEGIQNVIKPVKEAFREIFPPVTAQNLLKITSKIWYLTKNFKLSEEQAEKLKSTFKGVFSVIGLFGDAISSIIKGLSGLSGHAGSFLDWLLGVTAAIGEYITELRESIKATGSLDNAISSIVGVLKRAFSAVSNFMNSGFVDSLSSIMLGLWDIVKKVGGKIVEGISTMFSGLAEAFQNGDLGSFMDILNSGIFAVLLVKVKNFISGFTDSFKETGEGIISKFKGLLDGAAETLESVRGALETWQTNLKVSILLKIAAAVGILTLSLVVLSTIDREKIITSLGAVTTLFIELIAAMKLMTTGRMDGVASAFTAMIGIATAVFILAGALRKIADLNPEELERGVLSIGGLMAEIVAAIKLLSIGGGSAVKGAVSIVIFASSIAILASVAKSMAAMNWDELKKGLTGVGVLLAEVAAFMFLAKFGKVSFSTALGIVIISAALKILQTSVSYFAEMDSVKLTQGLIGVGSLLGMLAAFANLTGKAHKMFSSAMMLAVVTVSIEFLADILIELANVPFENMLTGLLGMVVMLAAVVAAANFLPEDEMVKASMTLPIITLALKDMAEALVMVGKLSGPQAFSSAAALIAVLFSLVGALHLMKGTLGASAAVLVASAALITMAGAFMILSSIGMLGVALGLVAMAGMFIMLGAAAKILGPAVPTIVKLSGSIATLGASFAVLGVGLFAVGTGFLAFVTSLTAALYSLKGLDWGDIVKGIATLAGVFIVIGVAAKLLRPLTGTIVTLSGSIALLGLSCMGVAIAISVMAAGLSLLAAAGEEGAKTIVASLTAIIVGIFEMLPQIIPSMMQSVKAIILGLLDVLVECTPAIIDGILTMLMETIKSMSEMLPMIVEFLFDFVISLIDGLAKKIPALVDSVANFLGALIGAIGEHLKGVSSSQIIDLVASVGLLSAMIAVLSLIAPMVPGAMLGVLGIGAVIAELALVLAAIGALAQIPGLTWIVEEGSKFMQTIGSAIGGFIGSIIGGIAQGITAALPQIGADLSLFMLNLTPFILGAKQIDATTMEGVNALVGVILALTAASLLDSLTSWLTGGTSLADFAAQLVPFGQAMVNFSTTVAGNIDEAAVVAAANAGKIMADMAASLPNSGGVVGFFTGENDMDVFGAQLVAFGACITAFSATVAGRVDETAVTSAANAGKTMAEMAKTLPNSGGVVGFFTGENNMDTFGTQLVSFGKSIASFCTTVAGKIDESAVTAAANAGRTMAELADTLPNSGGMKSWFVGDNDMATFGEQLRAFGSAMVGFSDEVSSVNSSSLTMAVDQATKLINMAKGAAGVDFGGLSDFGDSLGNIGALSVQNFVNAFHNSAADVADAGRTLVLNTLKGVDNAKTDFKNAGVNLVLELGTGISKAKGRAKAFATTMIADTLSAIREKYTSFKNAGKYLVEGFGKGIDENTWMAEAEARAMANAAEKAAKDALKVNSPSKVFIPLGKAIPEGLVKGMDMMGSAVSHSSEDMAHVALSSTRGVLANIADAVNSDIDTQPTIRPVLDLSDISSGAGAIGGLFGDQLVGVSANAGSISAAMNLRQNGVNNDVISAIKDLGRKMGTSTGNTYMINGISYSEGDDVSEALKTIVGAVRREGRS